jgi:hypothetical protein
MPNQARASAILTQTFPFLIDMRGRTLLSVTEGSANEQTTNMSALKLRPPGMPIENESQGQE